MFSVSIFSCTSDYERSNSIIENDISIKNYCLECKSDTQFIKINTPLTIKQVSSLFSKSYLPDSILLKGEPKTIITKEDFPYNPWGNQKTKELEKVTFTIDTAIIDYEKLTYNELGYLCKYEVNNFGDIQQSLTIITYSKKGTFKQIDIYSPIYYYGIKKPKDTYKFLSSDTVIHISHNVLKK